jgi:hypothetical protein
MPVYALPNFNQKVDVWMVNTGPGSGAPDFRSACQLYVNSRPQTDVTPGVAAEWVPPIILRLPMLTPVANNWSYQIVGDEFTGWYLGRWWERVHKGFPNEYRMVLLEQALWPVWVP